MDRFLDGHHQHQHPPPPPVVRDARARSSIPLNFDFAQHRLGEWTTLMLGESVLSLLITDGSGGDYLSVFYFGIVTIVLLQLLHFRSQPHDPKANAMNRSKDAGAIYSFVFTLYSVALVAVGVSYKLLLYGLSENRHDDDGDDDDDDGAGNSRALEDRFLVTPYDDDDGCHLDETEKARMVAHIFCGSLAMVFFCMDWMVLLHVGLKTQGDRTRRRRTSFTDEKTGVALDGDGTNVRGILFVVLPRVATTVFVATMSRWETRPKTLAQLGCAAVIVQLATRLLGDVFFVSLHNGCHDLHRRHYGGIDDDPRWMTPLGGV